MFTHFDVADLHESENQQKMKKKKISEVLFNIDRGNICMHIYILTTRILTTFILHGSFLLTYQVLLFITQHRKISRLERRFFPTKIFTYNTTLKKDFTISNVFAKKKGL